MVFAVFVAGVCTVVAMSVSFSRIAELPGLDGGHMGMAGLDVIDRDQGQAQVARFLEQAIERGLVCYGAMDDGGAVTAAGKGQPVEPGGPPGIEVPLEADLVPARVVMAAGRYFAHGAPSAVACLDGYPSALRTDRKSTRLNSSHLGISYAVFCLK